MQRGGGGRRLIYLEGSVKDTRLHNDCDGGHCVACDREKRLDIAEELTRRLLDEGKIIAAGWAIFRQHVVPKNAGPVQVEAMETAFLAGAEHLFSSIMFGLDPDAEPTADDERRMELIGAEIEAIRARFAAEGRAH